MGLGKRKVSKAKEKSVEGRKSLLFELEKHKLLSSIFVAAAAAAVGWKMN